MNCVEWVAAIIVVIIVLLSAAVLATTIVDKQREKTAPSGVFVDERGRRIPHWNLERKEQDDARTHVQPDAVVLELGARYGTVSSAINARLRDGRNHVAVEPDARVIPALRANRARNANSYHIFEGVVAGKTTKNPRLQLKGYSTTMVTNSDRRSNSRNDHSGSGGLETATVDELQQRYNLKFDTLVADCEGCLFPFFEAFPDFAKQLNTAIIEQDGPNKLRRARDYATKIDVVLRRAGLTKVKKGFHSVWRRLDPPPP